LFLMLAISVVLGIEAVERLGARRAGEPVTDDSTPAAEGAPA